MNSTVSPITGFSIGAASPYALAVVFAIGGFFIYRRIRPRLHTRQRSVIAELEEIKSEAIKKEPKENLEKKKKKTRNRILDILRNPFE
jgi:hypothetical protein